MSETGSLLDRLRAQRAAQLSEKRLTLPVPGWNGLLHVRYRPLPWEDLTDLLRRATDEPRAALDANCDTLAKACDALLVKDDDGDLRSLADVLRAQGEQVHGEVRFDEVACEVLGLEAASARETVLAVFGGAVSPEVAVAEQAGRLGAWMRGASEEVDGALVGG